MINIAYVCFAVLSAVGDDNPNVPTMLTDYILNGESTNADIWRNYL